MLAGQHLPVRGLHRGDLILPAAEILRHTLQHLLRIIAAGQGDHSFFGSVVLLAEVQQILPGIGLNLAGRAEDGLAGTLLAELGKLQQVMDQILRRVLVHGDLLQDNAALLFQLRLIHRGVDHQVGEDVHRQFEVLVNHLGVEAGAVAAGEGVELTADGVHFLGNLAGGALFGALEYHVLQEVAKAALLGRFHHGADVHPRADGHRAQVGQPLADHAQAIGKKPFVMHTIIRSQVVFHHVFHEVPSLCKR